MLTLIPVAVVFLHACGVHRVVLPTEAHVGVQHQLLLLGVVELKEVDALPGVFVWVAVDVAVGAPPVSEDCVVVVVVPDAGVLRIAPVTFVAGVFKFGATDRVSTVDRYELQPRDDLLPFIEKNVVDEDLFQCMATFLSVRHQSDLLSAFLVGDPASPEIVS